MYMVATFRRLWLMLKLHLNLLHHSLEVLNKVSCKITKVTLITWKENSNVFECVFLISCNFLGLLPTENLLYGLANNKAMQINYGYSLCGWTVKALYWNYFQPVRTPAASVSYFYITTFWLCLQEKELWFSWQAGKFIYKDESGNQSFATNHQLCLWVYDPKHYTIGRLKSQIYPMRLEGI